ncbi:MAG: Maf family protein [Emergencia sp.]
MKIILASGSPRRIEMMKKHGYDPEIIPADIDETIPEDMGMRDAVMYLALKKALWVEERLNSGSSSGSAPDSAATSGQASAVTPAPIPYLIIAADTVVYKDGILGKPVDRRDAERMLELIRHTSHYVATGVAIINMQTGVKKVFCDVTEVFCKNYSKTEMNAYLNTKEPYDKAGAYGIQGIFGKYIDHCEGSFDTVVGFPWSLIEPELKAALSK